MGDGLKCVVFLVKCFFKFLDLPTQTIFSLVSQIGEPRGINCVTPNLVQTCCGDDLGAINRNTLKASGHKDSSPWHLRLLDLLARCH